MTDDIDLVTIMARRLGHRFRSPALLEQALTHASEAVSAGHDNERLEFLGDAILDFIVSEMLYGDPRMVDEGLLTRVRSQVVRRETLARVATRAGIAGHVRRAAGVGNGARLPDSVLANVWEALIAAVHLDAGLDAARRLVERHMAVEIGHALQHGHNANAKALLQERLQQSGLPLPIYTVTGEAGPEHDRTFVVQARAGAVTGTGRGSSKKRAEQAAARQVLEQLDGGKPSGDG